MSNHDYICELCVECMRDFDPQLTIQAEIGVKMPGGETLPLGSPEKMIFAVFHTECIKATMDDASCDDVPFIWEARQMLDYIDNSRQVDLVEVLSSVPVLAAGLDQVFN